MSTAAISGTFSPSQPTTWSVRAGSILRAALAALATIIALIPVRSSAELAPGPKAEPPMAAQCVEDLAKRLKVPVADIRVTESWPEIWPDAALGLPGPDMAYAQMSTPGHVLILDGKSTRYVYTASNQAFKFAGAEPMWEHSFLFTGSPDGDANLNATLYQCSLLGTNRVPVATRVSGFYPQRDGFVAITRRTSRSSFDLLMVKVDGLQKEIPLFSAFGIGAAAFDDTRRQWAGFVKSGAGAAWNLTINGTTDDASKARSLPLPDGFNPQQIAWEGTKISILSVEGDKWTAYALDPTAAQPAWEKIAGHTFPGMPDYVLSKSQTLLVDDVERDGKPGVEVVRLWFHGERDLCARIEGLKQRGYDFLGGRYVVVWGEGREGRAACAVDIGTDQAYPCFGGIGGEMKAFRFPPHSSPLKAGPAQFER